jgi:hypothetical protein
MKIDVPRCNQNYTVASWSIDARIKIDLWRLFDVAEAIYLAPLKPIEQSLPWFDEVIRATSEMMY